MSNDKNNNIETLREYLFDALKGLKDGSMPVEKAKAMSDVSQTIINSAMVEVKHAQVTGSKGSTFLEKPAGRPKGVAGVAVRRLQG